MIEKEEHKEETMLPFRCPVCGVLILRYSADTIGHVEGKCRRCKGIFDIRIPSINLNS